MGFTAVGVAGLPVVAAQTPPATEAAAAANLAWEPCFQGDGAFQCATLEVPLDHSNPSSNRIPIALIRQRATDPSRRIGSLVLNPGGPGGSGVDFLREAGPFILTEEVRARFDLVSFDPRGIFRSRPLRCFESPAQWEPYFTPFAFPITPAETQQWIAADRYLLRACDQRAGAIINHMATADVARDMDLLRAALGDAQLNYVGYSYGSYLGVTYANLFPDRFRALVVDGVLDPVAWSTGAGNSARTQPVSQPLAQRRRRLGHAGRVLPAVRRRRPTGLRVRATIKGALRRPGRPPEG